MHQFGRRQRHQRGGGSTQKIPKDASSMSLEYMAFSLLLSMPMKTVWLASADGGGNGIAVPRSSLAGLSVVVVGAAAFFTMARRIHATADGTAKPVGDKKACAGAEDLVDVATGRRVDREGEEDNPGGRWCPSLVGGSAESMEEKEADSGAEWTADVAIGNQDKDPGAVAEWQPESV